MLFNPKFKGLGMIALPDMLVFKYIIPFFSPLADLLMVIGLFWKCRKNRDLLLIIPYY
jgi:hypothetical protein